MKVAIENAIKRNVKAKRNAMRRCGMMAGAVLLALVALARDASAASGVALVKDGAAVAEVVVPADATKVESFAASELVKFVERATGVRLRVSKAREKGRPAVLIGRAAGVGDALAPNEARVAAKDGALLLVGGDGPGDPKKMTTPAGTLFAVYDFLERELGVRWLWPDEDVGTSVPQRSGVSFAGPDRRWKPELVDACARSLENRFGRRLCRARKMPVNYPEDVRGHAFVHWWKTYGKTHPEFFEMNVNGTRVPGSMCVANPAFHQEIIRLWREARAKNPGVVYDINACENDTKGKCRCPLCNAWNDPEADPRDASERYAHFYKAPTTWPRATTPTSRFTHTHIRTTAIRRVW